MTTLQFRPAVRLSSKALIGIGGPSGGGKTLSALKIARGLCMGVDELIFGIDTENGRMLHYAPAEGEKPGAETFGFQHLPLEPPFSPMAYQEAIAVAVKAKAGCIIVDSASHEHEGEGGILEWHDRELDRMAGKDFEKRERVKFTAWIEPKRAHNKLVNKILQHRVHFIFCFRAKDKIAPVKNEKGKTEFVNVGWTPICADRFEYEMTTLLILPPNAKGVPDLKAERTKLNTDHVPAFPAGKPLDEAAGRAMAQWCAGKSIAPASSGRRDAKPAARPEPPPDQEQASGKEAKPAASSKDSAPQYHDDAYRLYRELRDGLEATADPELYWRNHPKGIATLKDIARGLFDDLVELAKSKKAGNGGLAV
jgi:hypothetical protein